MNIKEIRKNIDKTDKELARLLKERMDLSKEVALYKIENDVAVHNGLREREVLKNIAEYVGEPYDKYLMPIYSSIMESGKAYQYSLMEKSTEFTDFLKKCMENTPDVFPENPVVACQGIPGAYSETAATKMFKNPELMYFSTFESVFKAVETGLCKYGVLPIENSNYGSIGMTYDLMQRHNFYIVRSIKQPINHRLLAKPGTNIDSIKEIYSHEQALGQCHPFLESLKDVKIVPTSNTAIAAKKVAESDRTDIAAISSENCAHLYGLQVVADDIQMSNFNFTRFICISKNPEIYPGDNKISIMFKTQHKPMGLYHVIGRFAALGINICKLESRPVPGSNFNFMFYLDLDATIRNNSLAKTLGELYSSPEFFVFLGAYQEV